MEFALVLEEHLFRGEGQVCPISMPIGRRDAQVDGESGQPRPYDDDAQTRLPARLRSVAEQWKGNAHQLDAPPPRERGRGILKPLNGCKR